MDVFDRFIQACIPPNIYDQPRWVRRTFVLTLPISGPLWAIWFCGAILAIAAAGTIFMFGWMLLSVLCGALLPLLWIGIKIADLWSWPDQPDVGNSQLTRDA